MSGIYATTFCNKGHRLADGKPVGHECYIIPPRLLKAEREESPDALKFWQAWSASRRVVHRGVKEHADPVAHGTPNIPRFGRMTKDALAQFWMRYKRPSRADAEKLVGDRRPGFTIIASQIAAYAFDLTLEPKVYREHAKQRLAAMPSDIRAAVEKASRK